MPIVHRDYAEDRPASSVHMSDGPDGTQEFGYSNGLLVVDVDTLDGESFPVDDAYGPASPLVRAVAASIATADELIVGGLLDNAHLLRDVGESQHLFDSRLSRIARGTGRSAAVSRCEELARNLPIASPDDANVERLEVAVRVTLKTAALHDRLDDADRLRGYGPWETSLYFPERPPGQAATEETVASVEAALAALTPVALRSWSTGTALTAGSRTLTSMPSATAPACLKATRSSTHGRIAASGKLRTSPGSDHAPLGHCMAPPAWRGRRRRRVGTDRMVARQRVRRPIAGARPPPKARPETRRHLSMDARLLPHISS